MWAGKSAGLEVKRIINEPTAAALAYGLDKKKGDHKIAVYDLGGGTFDISIIEIAEVDGEHQFEVLSTNGDTFLGGEDFDRRLIDYLADEFKKDQGMDLRGDPLAMQRLKEGAEKAKIELSSSNQTEVNLPYITADKSGPKHLTMKVTRAKLESLNEVVVQRNNWACKLALKYSDQSAGDFDDVFVMDAIDRARFDEEALHFLAVVLVLGAQHFQRDLAAELDVLGEIDPPHAALAQNAQHLVRTDHLPGSIALE